MSKAHVRQALQQADYPGYYSPMLVLALPLYSQSGAMLEFIFPMCMPGRSHAQICTRPRAGPSVSKQSSHAQQLLSPSGLHCRRQKACWRRQGDGMLCKWQIRSRPTGHAATSTAVGIRADEMHDGNGRTWQEGCVQEVVARGYQCHLVASIPCTGKALA